MNIKDLKNYIKENKLKDTMEIIINYSKVYSYGICVKSKLTDEIGTYLSINGYDEEEIYRIRKKEKYINFCIKQGFSREEAKELFYKKYIIPYMPEYISISIEQVFWYEKELKLKKFKKNGIG